MSTADKNITWVGAFTHVAVLHQYLINNEVTLYVEYGVSRNVSAGATATAIAGSVDLAYRPTAPKTVACYVLNHSDGAEGYVTIGTDGSLLVGIGPTQAAFTFGAGEQGMVGFNVSYIK